MSLECSARDPVPEGIEDWAFREAVACGYQAQFGLIEVFAVIVLAAVGLALYIRTESLVLVYTVMTLTAGITLPLLTSPAHTLAILVLLLVPPGVMLAVYVRMEGQG